MKYLYQVDFYNDWIKSEYDNLLCQGLHIEEIDIGALEVIHDKFLNAVSNHIESLQNNIYDFNNDDIQYKSFKCDINGATCNIEVELESDIESNLLKRKIRQILDYTKMCKSFYEIILSIYNYNNDSSVMYTLFRADNEVLRAIE